LSEFVAETTGSAGQAFKIFYDATLLAEGEQITSEMIDKVLENEKLNLLALKIKIIEEKTPREYEVLTTIAELCSENEAITTGMLKDRIRQKGLTAFGRMLDY